MSTAHDFVRSARDALEPVSHRLSDVTRTDVTRVVVIASSSRGGSSLLFHLLRGTGAFNCLDGEHAHLYKLYGPDVPAVAGMHDGLVDPPSEQVADTFARELLRDATTADLTGPDSVTGYAQHFVRRIVGQWSTALPPVDELVPLVERHVGAATAGDRFDAEQVLLDVLADLRRHGAAVDPWYYDIAPGRIRSLFPDLPRPTGPPVDPIVEEPPFVVPRPGRALTDDDVVDRPLLLKASVDAYRLGNLAALFPKAEILVVHMVRNPAATINGLIDGWLSNGFFSYRLTPPGPALDISGYSHLPWGRSWWNFDLPAGWAALRGASLARVCATQWSQAHRSILDELADSGYPSIRIRAEHVMDSATDRRRAILSIMDSAGVWPAVLTDRPPQVVMATAAPRPARWRDRAGEICPEVAQPRIQALADRLGLGPEPDGSWT